MGLFWVFFLSCGSCCEILQRTIYIRQKMILRKYIRNAHISRIHNIAYEKDKYVIYFVLVKHRAAVCMEIYDTFVEVFINQTLS